MPPFKISNYLPQSYPFLFIDQILAYDYLKYAKTAKAVTYNEWFFQGHFPNNPILPGNIIIEIMAQTTGIFLYNDQSKIQKYTLGYLAKCNVKFFKKVTPGILLISESFCVSLRDDFCKAKVMCFVGNEKVAEGELILNLI